MTVAEMIAKVQSEAGIDADDATVRGWILDRIRRMIAAAQSRRELVAMATTTVGDATYPVPDDIVDIRTLWVDNSRYARQSIEEVVELQQGRAQLHGADGAWAPQYGGDASEGVTIWPTPDRSGDAIEALAAVLPPDTADGAEPPIPEDLQHGVWEGAIADGLSLMDEDPAAAEWEARFLSAVEQLMQRHTSKYGSGPGQIRVRY